MEYSELSVIFLLLLLCKSAEQWEPQLSPYGQNVQPVTISYQSKYYRRCGLWSRCSSYSTHYQTKYQCVPGWRSRGSSSCPYAICNGRTNPTGACNQVQVVMTRFEPSSLQHPEGKCMSPDNCVNCNKYFFNNGPRCTPCPKIENCLEMHCHETASSTICANCDGVVRDLPYYQAYIRSDNLKRCEQACSWRSDSTRCFPGYCDEGLAVNCKCVTGFTGKHCEKMTEKANILSNLFKLRANHLTIENPSDMNLVEENSPIVWSNSKRWKEAETEWVAKYVLKEKPHTDPNHYIKQFVYGIIEASTTLNYTYTTIDVVETVINRTDLLNDTNILNGTTYGLNDTSLPIINVTYVPKKVNIIDVFECPKASIVTPPTSAFDCQNMFLLESNSQPFNFSSGDTLTFTLEAILGGHLVIENREKKKKQMKPITL